MTDQILYTSDGTNLIVVGSNTINHNVTANLTVKTIIANGSVGTANQVLTTNGTGVYWANSTGGGGTAGSYLQARQRYVANGSSNTFTVTSGYSANNLDVYLNGVKLQNGVEANVLNGSTFTILTGNPANGSVIEVVGASTLLANGVSTIVNQQITANGSSNSFAITGGYISNSIVVFLNGVKQIPGVDVITTSGANVNFIVTPANNYVIDVYGYQTAVSYTSNTLIVGNTNIGLNSITSNGTSDSWFLGNFGIGTSSPTKKLDVLSANFDAARIATSYSGALALQLADATTTSASPPFIGSVGNALAFGRYSVAEYMRIDSSGNVGIGKTNPVYILDILKNGTNGYVQLTSDTASFYSAQYVNGATTVATRLIADATSGYCETATNHPLIFRTNATERARIDTSGNVLIGTNAYNGASTGCLHTKTTVAGNQNWTAWNTDTTGNRYFAYFSAGSTFAGVGSILYNGSATVYNTTSDRRLKENIVDAGSSIGKLSQIKIRSFDWKDNRVHVDFGIIAQELHEVAPEAVTVGNDNEDGSIKTPWQVDTSTLVPMLIAAMQEQQKQIEELKAEIKALKG
jgi:hypothetical protein